MRPCPVSGAPASTEAKLRAPHARSLLIHRRRQHEGLFGAQFFADQGEAEDAALEAVRETGEQRGFLFVFEQIELADDVIALFTGLDQLAERGLMAALAEGRGRRFGGHYGDKKSVVADA